MRRVCKSSKYNTEQALIPELGFGEFFNEKKEWTNEMTDALLEAFLVKDCRFISRRESLLSICGRRYSAITDQIWKLSANYNRKSVREYSPIQRTDRTGKALTPRDIAVFEVATSSQGIKNGAHLPEYIGKILGRSPEDVKQRMMVFYNSFTSFFDEEGNTEEEKVAKVVHQVIAGAYNRVVIRGLSGTEK